MAKTLILSTLGLFLISIISVCAWASYNKIYPIIAEKALIGGLYSGIGPVQMLSIRALRGYPTKNAAVSLTAFINLKAIQFVPDPRNPESYKEKQRRLQKRAKDLRLAEEALETLCLLSGESFGTYFKLEPYGHSWGSIAEDKWPFILSELDLWAVSKFTDIGDLKQITGASQDLPVFPEGTK